MYLFLKDSRENIQEAYKFELKYNPDGDKFYDRMPEPPEVKVHVIQFFEIIKDLGDISKLNNDVYPDITLFYNNSE